MKLYFQPFILLISLLIILQTSSAGKKDDSSSDILELASRRELFIDNFLINTLDETLS